MKTYVLFFFAACSLSVYGQLDNMNYNNQRDASVSGFETGIRGNAQNMILTTEVIFNAIPDGYHITYTTSFIAPSTQKAEELLITKTDSLLASLRPLGLSRNDVVVDIIALDPIFDFAQMDSLPPKGYKVTENVSFNLRDFSSIPKLSEICLRFGLYDLINAQAYFNDPKPVFQQMNDKCVELVNQKKKLCKDLGANIDNAKVYITRSSDVYYPSERYLRSVLTNAAFYKHQLSQNSTMSLNREVGVDNYFDYNLKQVDYVFNPGNNQPVIQFYYKLQTEYAAVDTEAEMRKKILEELEQKDKKKAKSVYTIDSEGNLQKLDID